MPERGPTSKSELEKDHPVVTELFVLPAKKPASESALSFTQLLEQVRENNDELADDIETYFEDRQSGHFIKIEFANFERHLANVCEYLTRVSDSDITEEDKMELELEAYSLAAFFYTDKQRCANALADESGELDPEMKLHYEHAYETILMAEQALLLSVANLNASAEDIFGPKTEKEDPQKQEDEAYFKDRPIRQETVFTGSHILPAMGLRVPAHVKSTQELDEAVLNMWQDVAKFYPENVKEFFKQCETKQVWDAEKAAELRSTYENILTMSRQEGLSAELRVGYENLANEIQPFIEQINRLEQKLTQPKQLEPEFSPEAATAVRRTVKEFETLYNTFMEDDFQDGELNDYKGWLPMIGELVTLKSSGFAERGGVVNTIQSYAKDLNALRILLKTKIDEFKGKGEAIPHNYVQMYEAVERAEKILIAVLEKHGEDPAKVLPQSVSDRIDVKTGPALGRS